MSILKTIFRGGPAGATQTVSTFTGNATSLDVAAQRPHLASRREQRRTRRNQRAA